MNRFGLFNPPVQESVPATPETRHDPRGVPAPWETQPNRSPIGYRQELATHLNPRRFRVAHIPPYALVGFLGARGRGNATISCYFQWNLAAFTAFAKLL